VRLTDDELLAEQRAFYRRRAPEYDEWWQRRGRYDRGEEETAEWRSQVATVDAALSQFGVGGDVLELAGGTGWWTERLAETARTLTVIDSSREALGLSRLRVGRPDVRYVVTDVFALPIRESCRFDVAFFSFWLSHVPRVWFGTFWALVRSVLKPDGRVFFIDNRQDPTPSRTVRDPYVVVYGKDMHLRRLSDGSEHRVVKVMYEPPELENLLAAEGWQATVAGTRWFIFGSATF
jgi:demethylmenaquinone methyltransferase/2-methoxy-6-polyprenyl-1,4-benzoquinol methylase